MRNAILSLVIFSALATQSDAVFAESFRLSVQVKSSGIRISGKGISNSCTVDVFGSSSEQGVQRSSRIKLASVFPTKKAISINLPLAASTKKGGSLFLRSVATCGKKQSNSQIVKLALTKSRNAEFNSSKELVIGLRQVSLRSLTKFVPSFENVNLVKPLDLQVAKGDGRLFAVEQDGIIQAIDSNKQSSVFLDISSLVSKGGERGLLGLAFDPDFDQTKRFYVNYTDLNGGTVISRFTVGSNGTTSLNAEEKILTFDQPFANHNGGALAFGPDKLLYIASGDGGSGGDPNGYGQSRNTLLGKILRIDVSPATSYSIPSTNPYVGNTSSFKEEIYAYGLRNPWRMSFDGDTLFAADVGQNSTEELNIIKNGGNYGWNIKEGSQCFKDPNCDSTGLIDPINEYGRDIGESITGGYVSRDLKSPNLVGVYLFADFMSGRVFALERLNRKWVRTELADTDFYISSFGRGNSKEIFFMTYLEGKIFKIQQK